MAEVVLEVKDLKKYFPIPTGFFGRIREWVKAVDGVSLTIRRGETLGLVGESGCGKTTLGKCIVRLLEPTDGQVIFQGTDILALQASAIRALRSEIQIVFQDPRSSLDPQMSVKELVAEGLRAHSAFREVEVDRKVRAALQAVGLSERDVMRYPHMFSGGQQQRIALARMLVLSPKFVVLDEPTSALDVSIQATLLNLLKRLQTEFSLTYILISHDIRAIRALADRVAVMYLGKIVEQGVTDRILSNPIHPYTKALLSAVPIPDPSRRRKRLLVPGEIPSAVNPPPACRFHPRCPFVFDRCRVETPRLMEIEKGHYVACHLYDKERFGTDTPN